MIVSQKTYTKIKGYVGFAVKAGQTVLGTDNILNTKKIYIVIADSALSQNALKKINKHCQLLGCPLYYITNTADLIAKKSCKVFGVKDKNLATAIINALENNAVT